MLSFLMWRHFFSIKKIRHSLRRENQFNWKEDYFIIDFNLFIFFFRKFVAAVNSVSHAPVSMSPNVITTSEKKKVFVTGSGNIEVTQVSQPISHPQIGTQNLTPNVTSNVSAID